MILRQIVSFFLFCLLSLGLAPMDVLAQTAVYVDDVVAHKIAENGVVSANVYFGQADLSSINRHRQLSKVEKGRKVYNLLIDQAKRSQKRVVSYLSQKKIDFRSFLTVNIISLDIDQDLLNALSQMSEIEAILYNAPTFAARPEVTTITQNTVRDDVLTWGLEMVRADSVWAMGHKGKGVVVAGEDTGVKWDIPAIENAYRGRHGDHNYNWHDAIHQIDPMNGDSVILPTNNPCGLDSKEPCDDHSHGTHTIGTMVGEDGENEDRYGTRS